MQALYKSCNLAIASEKHYNAVRKILLINSGYHLRSDYNVDHFVLNVDDLFGRISIQPFLNRFIGKFFPPPAADLLQTYIS